MSSKIYLERGGEVRAANLLTESELETADILNLNVATNDEGKPIHIFFDYYPKRGEDRVFSFDGPLSQEHKYGLKDIDVTDVEVYTIDEGDGTELRGALFKFRLPGLEREYVIGENFGDTGDGVNQALLDEAIESGRLDG